MLARVFLIKSIQMFGGLLLLPHYQDHCILFLLLIITLGRFGFTCLREKSDAFDMFKQWKAMVEKQTGRKLKCLRTDNGGEFTSAEFD